MGQGHGFPAAIVEAGVHCRAVIAQIKLPSLIEIVLSLRTDPGGNRDGLRGTGHRAGWSCRRRKSHATENDCKGQRQRGHASALLHDGTSFLFYLRHQESAQEHKPPPARFSVRCSTGFDIIVHKLPN